MRGGRIPVTTLASASPRFPHGTTLATPPTLVSEWKGFSGKRSVALERWVDEVAAHTTPSLIRFGGPEGGEVALTPDPDTGNLGAVEYVSVARPQDSGPLNRWIGRADAEDRVWRLLRGSMTGRTMFVVPYILGSPGGYLSRAGVQLTDSPYAASTLRQRLWTGSSAYEWLGDTSFFARLVHSKAMVPEGEPAIVHFPETQEIWSVGSDAPLSALLPRRGHALRLGSQHAMNEGWLAVRGSIVCVEPPGGAKIWLVVAGEGVTPSGTVVDGSNGWRAETASTAASFVHIGRDGKLWAAPAEHAGLRVDALNREVPVAGFLFTTSRSRVAPLLLEASTWRHGVYQAASLLTERLRSPSGPGILVNDPLCMGRDCGAHIGEYLDHWLSIGRQLAEAPRMYFANTARVTQSAARWPNGAANLRLLAWIYGRLEGEATGVRTPIGVVPTPRSIDTSGLDLPAELLERLLAPDGTEWARETERITTFFAQLGSRLPNALRAEHRALLARLDVSIH
jgi:GTP-dependent phosphoenolpyruvate carboxykinase